MITKIIIFILAFINILCFANCYNDLVNTTSGVVRGQTIQVLDKSIGQFLNIPYAEPPLGKLRFAKPIPLRQQKQVLLEMNNFNENNEYIVNRRH